MGYETPVGKSIYCWPDNLISQVLGKILPPPVGILEDPAPVMSDHGSILVTVEQPGLEAELFRLRRRGFKGPILFLSLSAHPGEGHQWFARYYDECLRLPCGLDEIKSAIDRLRNRSGKRPSLVKAAVLNAWAERFDSHRLVDHQWENFAVILRFLRGAQMRFAIHPEDAMDIITYLGEQRWVKDQEKKTQRLSRQVERWNEYSKALVRHGVTPPRWSERQDNLPFTLLVIDDQVKTLGWGLLFNRLLFQHGFEVVTDDGTGYGAAIQRHNPDVILLDLNFENLRPGDSLYGFTILADIREIDPTIPVILFSASETLALERKRQELGMVGYIVKSEKVESQDPIGYYDRLLDLLRKAIEHRIRFHLNALCSIIEGQDPDLFEIIRDFIQNALAEVEDHRATAHNVSLTIEQTTRWLLRKKGELSPMLKQNFEHFEKKLISPWSDILTIARLFRNATAHSALGAASVSREDARLGCILAVFLVAEMDEIRLSALASDLVASLDSLLAKVCGEDLAGCAEALPRCDNLRAGIESVGNLLRTTPSPAIPDVLPRLFALCRTAVDEAIHTIPPRIIAPARRFMQIRTGDPSVENLLVWPPLQGSWELSSLPSHMNKHVKIEHSTDGPVLKLIPPSRLSDPIQLSFSISFKVSQAGHPANGLEISKDVLVKFEKTPWTNDQITVFTETGSALIDLRTYAREHYLGYTILESKNCAEATVDPDNGTLSVQLIEAAREGKVRAQARIATTREFVKAIEINISYPLIQSLPEPAPLLELSPFSKNLKLLQSHSKTDESDDLREGFEHVGIVPYVLLGNIDCLERYQTREAAEGLEPGAAHVTLLMLTRLVSWCVKSVIVPWNPSKQVLYEHAKRLGYPVDPRAFTCCRKWEAFQILYETVAGITRDKTKAGAIRRELEVLRKKSKDIDFRLNIIKQRELRQVRQREQTITSAKPSSPQAAKQHGRLTQNLGSLLKGLSVPLRDVNQEPQHETESKEGLEASYREISARIRSLESLEEKLEESPSFAKPYDIKMLVKECVPSQLTTYDSIERLIENWQSFEGEGGAELQSLLNEIVTTFSIETK